MPSWASSRTTANATCPPSSSRSFWARSARSARSSDRTSSRTSPTRSPRACLPSCTAGRCSTASTWTPSLISGSPWLRCTSGTRCSATRKAGSWPPSASGPRKACATTSPRRSTACRCATSTTRATATCSAASPTMSTPSVRRWGRASARLSRRSRCSSARSS